MVPFSKETAMKKIVLIEDEQHIAEALRFLFTQQGWKVAMHNDGATALDLIRSEAPDLVVLDIMILNKSGLDVLREMRESKDVADIPVLMLTAKGQANNRMAAELAGATQFMTKPFSNAELIETVRALIP